MPATITAGDSSRSPRSVSRPVKGRNGVASWKARKPGTPSASLRRSWCQAPTSAKATMRGRTGRVDKTRCDPAKPSQRSATCAVGDTAASWHDAGGFDKRGSRRLRLAARMPAARALPWLLAGVVLAGCAATGPGLRVAPEVLVDLRTLDPSIRIDIHYATPHNLTGVVLYPVARCLVTRDVAERLVRVQRRLAVEGLGLLVWDCYRPF